MAAMNDAELESEYSSVKRTLAEFNLTSMIATAATEGNWTSCKNWLQQVAQVLFCRKEFLASYIQMDQVISINECPSPKR